MPYLKKRFGQHHLRQGELCEPLIRFLAPNLRSVVEIGPGGGVLTRKLLDAGARVIAVELDPAWAFELIRRVSNRRLDLIIGDALDLGWSRAPGGLLVAGNLPFGISTRLIDRVLGQSCRISKAGFMVQKEVADRLLAQPGDGAYGGLSVLTSARASVRLLGRIAPGSFSPPPKVEAAFIGLETMEPVVESAAWSSFASTVHLAFSQRRKQLRNALASQWGRALTDRVLEQAGIPATTRAEELGLDDFVRLFRTLQVLERSGLRRRP